MIIHRCAGVIISAIGESMEVKLPRKGLKIDPRANHPRFVQFSVRYHDDDITVTLTRVDNGRRVYYDPLFIRMYDPEIETVPAFNTTVYVYCGLDGEFAPKDTTDVIIHESVKIIKKNAFRHTELRRVVVHDNVEIIERCAFYKCSSLVAMYLPSSLKKIGDNAFAGCSNLRILSMPPQMKTEQIGVGIVYGCDTFFRSTQIQPYNSMIQCGGGGNKPGDFEWMMQKNNTMPKTNHRVHQDIIDFHRNLPHLYQTCLNTNVTAQSIRHSILLNNNGTEYAYNTHYDDDDENENDDNGMMMTHTYSMYTLPKSRSYHRSWFSMFCIPQHKQLLHSKMTPMHILALNPHADTGAILELFHANMGEVFEPYTYMYRYSGEGDDCYDNERSRSTRTCSTLTRSGKTVLDFLEEYNSVAYLSIMVALCVHKCREQQ